MESILGAHARLLRTAGHDVVVVAGRGEPDIEIAELDSRHPDVEALARSLAQGSSDARFDQLREVIQARLSVELADRDVLVAHNVLTMPFNLPAAAALGALGKPVVAWTHDVAWINPLYAAYRRDESPWSLLRRPQPRTTYVAVSAARRDELVGVLGVDDSEIPVVPNGVDFARVIGLQEHTRVLAGQAGLLASDPLLLCPLRITPRKRLELAIEAAAELGHDEPNLKLAISGPLGAHSAENRAYAEHLQSVARQLRFAKNVIFMHQLEMGSNTHPVTDDDIAGLFRLADVIVMPSESEGFGLPVLEAGAARAPIVCADIPVLREVSGGDAWLFEPAASASELAGVIRKALDAPAARLRRRARSLDWARIVPGIEGVLEAAGA